MTIGFYLLLVAFGWMNVCGASVTYEQSSLFDLSMRSGQQFLWIGISLLAGIFLLSIDWKLYDMFAYIAYGFWVLVLLATPFLAHDTQGSMSWISFGSIKLQPAEFAKCLTALAVAKYMSRYEFKVRGLKDFIVPFVLIGVPMLIIMVPQKETGSALVFAAFLLAFYREGMTGYILLIAAVAVFFFIFVIRLGVVPLPLGTGSWGMVISMLLILIIELFFMLTRFNTRGDAGKYFRMSAMIISGVVVLTYVVCMIVGIWVAIPYEWVSTGLVLLTLPFLIYSALRWRNRDLLILLVFVTFSVAYCYSCDFAFKKILQPHQRARIELLLGLKDDPSGVGYNVKQAQIAIGSGRLLGKGFLQGTQTKLQFVPEQATDFIFCTVGEEWGFVGSSLVLIVYLIFILRLIYLAERQKDKFSMIYGYCVASIFFFHLAINVGMVLGLLPVIGIPLPFFSYGGSSLLGFTVLLFIFLNLDAARIKKM